MLKHLDYWNYAESLLSFLTNQNYFLATSQLIEAERHSFDLCIVVIFVFCEAKELQVIQLALIRAAKR